MFNLNIGPEIFSASYQWVFAVYQQFVVLGILLVIVHIRAQRAIWHDLQERKMWEEEN